MFEQKEYDGQDFAGLKEPEQQVEELKCHDCRFDGVDFSESVFKNCSFEKCRFTGARLGACRFEHCSIVNCTFQYAGLFAAVFEECKLTGTVFVGANTASIQIIGGDWSYTDLREMDFYKMELENINFRGADLNRAKLEKCRIKN